jgi:hypothetical protein
MAYKDPEEKRAYQREWSKRFRKKCPEVVRERKRRWRLKHPEKCREMRRRRYRRYLETHRDSEKERLKKHRETHREEINLKKRVKKAQKEYGVYFDVVWELKRLKLEIKKEREHETKAIF